MIELCLNTQCHPSSKPPLFLFLIRLFCRQLHSLPPWTCWMEISTLVIFEAGRSTYIQD